MDSSMDNNARGCLADSPVDERIWQYARRPLGIDSGSGSLVDCSHGDRNATEAAVRR